MNCIHQSLLDLMGWKRVQLGHVQNFVKEKQLKLDALQQGLITIYSKGEDTVLVRDIDKLRKVDYVYWCRRSKMMEGQRGRKYSLFLSTFGSDK
ncbi:hypothetical protein LIER_31754 [Lithospermum erythrorhizon]|uniref:Uncharacterized protein n=1 Tax=Lithospermum erythrorhizon TaxID=34254 RepID=A0AAV3RXU4_LITER